MELEAAISYHCETGSIVALLPPIILNEVHFFFPYFTWDKKKFQIGLKFF
jgi:hypothetical protein